MIFRKLKLYEEQELTMQVFSEPDNRMDPSEPHMLNIQVRLQIWFILYVYVY
jgi:hypothetical protein